MLANSRASLVRVPRQCLPCPSVSAFAAPSQLSIEPSKHRFHLINFIALRLNDVST